MKSLTTRLETLSIVIPALNEEEAIGSTITRCLQASGEIREAADLDDVEIIVVNDGSTDRTSEIAHGFAGVKVIDFAKNQGYGAAIKEGFRQGTGSLVGFLDADGTCDPRYFAEMSRVALHEDADMVLGSRLGPDSKMPRLRRLGNRLYAILLGLLCGRHVTDTASGMRVIRRTALDSLYPLPNGLHFTPSMSARALLNGMRVVEIPMRYEERVGTSKLRILTDGVRFLRTILAGVLCYRPERLFLMGFTVFLLLAVLLAANPTEFYLENGRVEDWMIYRFIVCFLLGSSSFVLLCGAALAHRMAILGPARRDGSSFWPPIIARLFEGRIWLAFMGAALLASVVLLFPAIIEYFGTGRVTMHWARIFVGAFGLLIALHALVTGTLLQVVAIWQNQHIMQALRQREQLPTPKPPRQVSSGSPVPNLAETVGANS
jgi:glycosyltransferase involved in cell wall biosynthesis